MEMVFFPVVNETCRVYSEGIAVKAADLDIAGVMGMGFPPYRFVLNMPKFVTSKPCYVPWFYLIGYFWIRGGVMFWADSIGSKYIYSKLEKWSNLYGEFFKPCAYLAERAAKGSPLVSCENCATEISIVNLFLTMSNFFDAEYAAGKRVVSPLNYWLHALFTYVTTIA